jgi:hypothetical protein
MSPAALARVVGANRGNASVQRWTWPWETEDDTPLGGGGESGGGGASGSWDAPDAGLPGGVPDVPSPAPDEGPLVCEPDPEGENACYEPPNYSPADRSWTCSVTCNVYAVTPGAKCPERVSGTGSGASVKAACDDAKKDANNGVPAGCNKRHCDGPCDGSQGSKGRCR